MAHLHMVLQTAAPGLAVCTCDTSVSDSFFYGMYWALVLELWLQWLSLRAASFIGSETRTGCQRNSEQGSINHHLHCPQTCISTCLTLHTDPEGRVSYNPVEYVTGPMETVCQHQELVALYARRQLSGAPPATTQARLPPPPAAAPTATKAIATKATARAAPG